MTDTVRWPFIPARDFKVVGGRKVRLVVIHDMEFPETHTAARDVARYFQHPDTPSSAHICVDDTEVIQSVWDSNVAYAAPGANNDGIQIELAGYAKQTCGEWLDPYGLKLLALAADATAQYCLKYEIPPVHLTNAELLAGKKGIIGHYQASAVYKKSDHQDPGIGFPWSFFVASVANHILLRSPK